MTKTCTKCGVEKALSEFYKRKKSKDGLTYRCKECQNKYHKKKYFDWTKLDAEQEKKYLCENSKTCKRCGVEKAFSEFHKNKKSKDGLAFYCKKCVKARNKKIIFDWTKIDKEQEKKYLHENSKTCKKCGINKNFSEFHKSSKTKSGIATYCKECQSKYQKENSHLNAKHQRDFRKRHPGKASENQKKYYTSMGAGIYRIKNKKTGACYIGFSTTIRKRWVDHKNRLKKNKHENTLLQKAYDEFGLDIFEFEVIKQYPPDTAVEILEEEEKKTIWEAAVINGEKIYNERIYRPQHL